MKCVRPLQRWENRWAPKELTTCHCVILLWPSFLGKVALGILSLLPQTFLWDCLKLHLCTEKEVECELESKFYKLPCSLLYFKLFVEIIYFILDFACSKDFIVFPFLAVSEKFNFHFLYLFINLTQHFCLIFLFFLMLFADFKREIFI